MIFDEIINYFNIEYNNLKPKKKTQTISPFKNGRRVSMTIYESILLLMILISTSEISKFRYQKFKFICLKCSYIQYIIPLNSCVNFLAPLTVKFLSQYLIRI